MTDRGFRRFRISVVFRAPIRFAYAWCTDYSSEDPKFAREDARFRLQRRVVERTTRRVVFENLYEEEGGWVWERHTVTLSPPDRWHSDGVGVYQESHLDYRLTERPGGRTRLVMRWRSRPTVHDRGARRPKAVVERFVRELWRLRGRALEQAYRETLAPQRGSPTPGTGARPSGGPFSPGRVPSRSRAPSFGAPGRPKMRTQA